MVIERYYEFHLRWNDAIQIFEIFDEFLAAVSAKDSYIELSREQINARQQRERVPYRLYS